MNSRQHDVEKKISEYNTNFNFGWNDHRTIEHSKALIPEIEKFYEDNYETLFTVSSSSKKELAELSYKFGTYQNHVARMPEKALGAYIYTMDFAEKEMLAWCYLHVAFSYQQLMFSHKNQRDQFENFFLMAVSFLYIAGEDEKLLADPKFKGFALCVEALIHYENDELEAATKTYQQALELYENHNMFDVQYLRAKNRYLQFLAEQEKTDEAYAGFIKLEQEWEDFIKTNRDSLNPYIGRFYITYANFLTQLGKRESLFAEEALGRSLLIEEGMQKYKKAYEHLVNTDGEDSKIVQEMQQKMIDLQSKLSLDAVLNEINWELAKLPFSARELFIENLSTILLRGFIPMSGMTIQQKYDANSDNLFTLNQLLKKNNAFRNAQSEPRFVYQFPREATSGGVIPAYIDKKGNVFVGMICNSRNTKMYNVCAGYTEAPYPAWRGQLLSEPEKIVYDRAKVKESAALTMQKLLINAKGSWTNVDYDDGDQFKKDLAEQQIKIPKTDMNALATATRECLEEMSLDLKQFPNRKIFLCSHDNTLGISQGDAPGQMSNKNDLYFVLLGEFDEAPFIKAGDDVVIADWVNIENIERKSATEYFANDKPLCIYMLRGLETGLQQLWDHLIAEKSKYHSVYANKDISRFSSTKNLAAYLENYCEEHQISIQGTNIESFLKYLTKDHLQTRTGTDACRGLMLILNVIEFLQQKSLSTQQFVDEFPKMLGTAKINPKTKLSMLFKPVDQMIVSSKSEQEKQSLVHRLTM